MRSCGHAGAVAAVGPHVHDAAVECFYVVEGSYRITVSGADHEITPGGFALVPRGAPHQFEVTGGQEGRTVVVFAPAGFESVFRKMPEISGTPGEPGPLWQRLDPAAPLAGNGRLGRIWGVPIRDANWLSGHQRW